MGQMPDVRRPAITQIARRTRKERTEAGKAMKRKHLYFQGDVIGLPEDEKKVNTRYDIRAFSMIEKARMLHVGSYRRFLNTLQKNNVNLNSAVLIQDRKVAQELHERVAHPGFVRAQSGLLAANSS